MKTKALSAITLALLGIYASQVLAVVQYGTGNQLAAEEYTNYTHPVTGKTVSAVIVGENNTTKSYTSDFKDASVHNVLVGSGNNLSASDLVLIGQANSIDYSQGIILGDGSKITADKTQADIITGKDGGGNLKVEVNSIGHNNILSKTGEANVLGNNNTATDSLEYIIVGHNNTLTKVNKSVVLGGENTTTANNAVVLGYNSTNGRDNTVSVGSDTNKRQITNVADGVEESDVATVKQVQEAGGTQAELTDMLVNAGGTPPATGKVELKDVLTAINTKNTNQDTTIANNSNAIASNGRAIADNREAIGKNYLAIKANSAKIASNTSRIEVAESDIKSLKAENIQQNVRMDNFENRMNVFDGRLAQTEKELSKGIAGVTALASLPNIADGKINIALGSGYYNGESAVSLGVTGSFNDRLSYKIGGAFGGDTAVGVGVSYRIK